MSIEDEQHRVAARVDVHEPIALIHAAAAEWAENKMFFFLAIVEVVWFRSSEWSLGLGIAASIWSIVAFIIGNRLLREAPRGAQ
jgi:hypothetical protein